MKDNQDPLPKNKAKWPPLSGDYFVGNPAAGIAVMACGSYDLPRKLVEAKGNRIAIAGFCETENEGIAKIIQNIVSNPRIRHVIVCGERVRGHEPGQTLIALHSNGLDEKHAVLGSRGTIPTLLPTYFRGDDPSKYVKRFMQQVISVVEMVDETSIQEIGSRIDELSLSSKDASFEQEPMYPPQPKQLNDWKKALASYVRRTKRQQVKTRCLLGAMFTFTEADLIVYDLCGTKIGGQRGEYPTVMAGTIFYTKDKIVTDPKTGAFSKDAAIDLIRRQDELSLHYNFPVMVHIVGQTKAAIEKYILFTVDQTDSPIIIDSSSVDTRLHGIRLAKDIGIEDRAIYNSVITTNKEEQNAFKEIGGVEYAVLLSYEESAEDSIKKTRQLLKYFGPTIKKPIIDPGVPVLGRGSSSALERAWILKNQLGFPTAIGIHNLHSSQQGHKDIEFSFDYTLPTIFGVDINLYGPIKNAARIFPSVVAAQIAVADEAFKNLGVLPRQPHPYYKVLGSEQALHQQPL